MTEDLLNRLVAANPVPPQHVAGAARDAKARAIFRAIVKEAPPGQRPRSRRVRTRVALAAAAIVVTLGLTMGPALWIGRGGTEAEADFLLRAAAIAARQGPERIPSDGYWYTKAEDVGIEFADPETVTVYGGLVPSILEKGTAIPAFVRSVGENWVGPDGSGRSVTRIRYTFLSEKDRAAWQVAGIGLDKAHRTDYPPGGFYREDLTSLPTDPDELEEVIRERAEPADPPTNVEMFVVVGDLFRQGFVQPELRSALLQVAARIEGVELVGPMTDPEGRPGLTVGIETDHWGWRQRLALIFNPHTFELLAEKHTVLEPVKGVPIEPPITIYSVVYLESGIVGSTSERP